LFQNSTTLSDNGTTLLPFILLGFSKIFYFLNKIKVRTGCHFVAILEIFYVLLVLITILFHLYDNGSLKFWTKLNKTELNYNKIVNKY